MNALMPKRNQKEITSLIEEFQYPKHGPGMMWERCRDQVEAKGCTVADEPAGSSASATRTAQAVAVVAEDRRRHAHRVPVRPRRSRRCRSRSCCRRWTRRPRPTRSRRPTTCATATSSPSRSSCPSEYSFPDNWIYVHSRDVQVGRIQNFGSWSPYLVKEGRTCLGLEFFVFEGDETWNTPDDELIEQGKRELEILGLVDPAQGRSAATSCGCRRRIRSTTRTTRPTCAHRRVARGLRTERAPGRAQRHAPLQQPGPLDVHRDAHRREHRRPARTHDVWDVNVEEEYHEESSGGATTPSWHPRDRSGRTGDPSPSLRRGSPGAPATDMLPDLSPRRVALATAARRRPARWPPVGPPPGRSARGRPARLRGCCVAVIVPSDSSPRP